MNIIECLLKANQMTLAYTRALMQQARQGVNVKKRNQFRFQLFTEDQILKFETSENIKLFEACTEKDKADLVSIFFSIQCNNIKLTPKIFHDCCEFPNKEDLACVLETMNDGDGFQLNYFEILICKDAPHYPDLKHHPLVHKFYAHSEILDPIQLKAILKETKKAINFLKRKVAETQAAPSLQESSLFKTPEEPEASCPKKKLRLKA
jgi:hypothetical protein